MVVILMFVAVGCGGSGGGNGLDGRWESDAGIIMLEFSGDRFTRSLLFDGVPNADFDVGGTFSLSRNADHEVMERIFETGDRLVSIIRMPDRDTLIIFCAEEDCDCDGHDEGMRFTRVS